MWKKKEKKGKKEMVALQQLQDNTWIFELLGMISDTTIFKTYVIKFVVFLTSLNFLDLLKVEEKEFTSHIFLVKKKKSLIYPLTVLSLLGGLRHGLSGLGLAPALETK